MRAKLAVFGAVIVAFALFQIFLFPRPVAVRQAEALVPRLLPPAIGEFHRTREWKSYPAPHTMEVGASYGRAGIEAKLDYWLGDRIPHNAVACWYVRGTPMVWQRLEKVRTAGSDPVFDLALFQNARGYTLFADTECYSDGCREQAVAGRMRLQWPMLTTQGTSPVPVSVLVSEPDTPQSQADARLQLVRDFRRFAAKLDLRPLRTIRRR